MIADYTNPLAALNRIEELEAENAQLRDRISQLEWETS